MRKRVLSILLALSVILAYVPMMGITAVAEGTVNTTPVTFTSGSSFSIKTANGKKNWGTDGTIQYRTDTSSEEWTTWDGTTSVAAGKNGDSYILQFRGKGNTVVTGALSGNTWTITGTNVEVSGNIMTLLDYDEPNKATMGDMAFAGLFNNNATSLTNAANLELPATKLATSCYHRMFAACKVLTKTPELPATELAPNCYYQMFHSCREIKEIPDLPAMKLTPYCYYQMFCGCFWLTEIDRLPATELAEYCYFNMFGNCGRLTKAPELPATELAPHCYQSMFASGCNSLVQAPELPATHLAEYCYTDMFNGCKKLTETPELPAERMYPYCYQRMFAYCTNDNFEAPKELPAEKLAEGCYQEMFCQLCNNSDYYTRNGPKVAPKLPATKLAKNCYKQMFYDCDALIEPPELPATELAEGCYQQMFQQCDGLVRIPELPATELAMNCYKNMFIETLIILTDESIPGTEWSLPVKATCSSKPAETSLEDYCYLDMFDEIVTQPKKDTTYHYCIDGTNVMHNKAYQTTITITQQPSSSNNYTVIAKAEPTTSAEINYQWYKKEGDTSTLVEGQVTNTLSPNLATSGDTYYCKCTSSIKYNSKEYDEVDKTVKKYVSKEVNADKISNDVVYKPLPAETANAKYYASLTLGDNIDVNLTIKNLTDFNEAKKNDLKIFVDGNALNAEDISLVNGEVKCILCSKAPQHADKKFDVDIEYKGVVVKSFTYTVRDYCRNVITKYPEPDKSKGITQKFLDLCKAFLYYTSCADLLDKGDGTDFIGTKDEKDAYKAIAIPESSGSTVKPGEAYASLNIDSCVNLNFYIKLDDNIKKEDVTNDTISIKNGIGELVAKENIAPVDIITDDEKNEFAKVTILNIGASKLSKVYTLTINGKSDFKIVYGIYNYLKERYDQLSNEETKTEEITDEMNLLQAMYIYSEAAKEYYKESKIGGIKYE